MNQFKICSLFPLAFLITAVLSQSAFADLVDVSEDNINLFSPTILIILGSAIVFIVVVSFFVLKKVKNSSKETMIEEVDQQGES